MCGYLCFLIIYQCIYTVVYVHTVWFEYQEHAVRTPRTYCLNTKIILFAHPACASHHKPSKGWRSTPSVNKMFQVFG